MATRAKKDLNAILALIGGLSADDCVALRPALKNRESQVVGDMVWAKRAETVNECPHCQGSSVMRHGTCRKGHQRFLCRRCKKTFSRVTNSPLAGYRKKDKHFGNACLMVEKKPHSVREIAAKLGINKNTALKWRHRFLKALAEAPPPLLSGIVEVDEAFIQPSNKGQKIGPSFKPEGSRGTAGMVPVLVARARFEQTTHTQVMPHCDTAAIDAALSPLLRCDAILCTDGAAMYPLIAKRLGIEHHPVINPKILKNQKKKAAIAAKGRPRALYHIQTTDNYIRRLKDWLQPFDGVATKHLPLYLAWHRYVLSTSTRPSPAELLTRAVN
ncbi:IS1595 family transposase [Lysobacter enzymogenes]|uniref:IS1595 family transposase n=1 Tax=Lysobacter enzymogenes TaxID=69 RepID=UPI001A9599F1|nr:IS1595 family transposase [Lysobacter enzymogenes]QQP97973.1 IS1595 family transposase [Lysobacter enzymogenes]